jgi:hypothetical protein
VVIPGRIEDANYDVLLHIGESRDSGSGPSDHPGMTGKYKTRRPTPAFFAPQHRFPATPANGQWPFGGLLCIGAGHIEDFGKPAPPARLP